MQSAWAGEPDLIGTSLGSLKKQLKLVAERHSWVLVTGENGTGKDVVARYIHAHSLRNQEAFVPVNCAAIPEELIESELFGHVKGAFTNALGDKKGKFELADRGTLFLDEVADMSLKTQAKILRVLQEQTFERVGDEKSIKVNVRVIGATNKDLMEEIEKGTFREDLYYRLKVIPIHLPPLRERLEDIPELCDYFLEKICLDAGLPPKRLAPGCLDKLMRYDWPGNVRELKNLLERCCILSEGELIPAAMIPASYGEASSRTGRSILGGISLREARTDFERAFIVEKLDENDWNVSKTAEAIGIERSNLHRKIKAYNIDLKDLKT
jgi:two-component system nitrogen regulation response regulator NtrX